MGSEMCIRDSSYLSVLSMFVEEKKITPEEIKELIRQVEAGSQNEKP